MLFLPSFEPITYLCLKIFLRKAFSFAFLCREWPGFFSLLVPYPLYLSNRTLRGRGPGLLLAHMLSLCIRKMDALLWTEQPVSGCTAWCAGYRVGFQAPLAPLTKHSPLCGKQSLQQNTVGLPVTIRPGCFPDCFHSVQLVLPAPKYQ